MTRISVVLPFRTEGIEGLDFRPLPTGRFRVGLFDYPWKFSAGVKGRPQHYHRMTDDEIAASNPLRILHPDGAWLLIWCTGPKAQTMFRLVEYWQAVHGRRIKYSTRVQGWMKLIASHPGLDVAPIFSRDIHHGMGLVAMKNLEDLWAFKVGPARLQKRGEQELLIAPRREYSRKPDESYVRLRRMFRGPCVEVFARQPREGWSVWGDESGKFEGINYVALADDAAA